MSDFIASADRERLARAGLESFEALWTLPLEAVDAPNTDRGGWSAVFRLELDGAAYYLKRQRDHLIRSLRHPFGEPTLAHEWFNIQRYQAAGVPALEAAYFGMRRVQGEQRAILLTRALDGWQDLAAWQACWPQLPEPQRQAIVSACGRLMAHLHDSGLRHASAYPKHLFLRPQGEGFDARFIDLEKSRRLWGRRGRLRDLEPLLRRSPAWGRGEVLAFLAAYLGEGVDPEPWFVALKLRRLEQGGVA